MKKILAALLLICTVWGAGAQERKSMDNQTIDGYRGIWFTIGQARSGYGDKYSGGLGTYTMKHMPMAVYSPEADKTFFVYGGTPSEERKYLLCMVGCYDHKTGMLRRPVVVYDKGVAGVGDPHDDPTIQLDKEGYVWVFVAGRANKRPGIRYRSTKPYDISEFEYVNESIMAYPQVHYHPEKGFFLFFTRYDGVRRLFYQSSTDGIRWTDYRQIASIIDEGETKSGHYQFTNLCGDKLMCCFNRHINGNVDTRTNIQYIQSEDWGRRAQVADRTLERHRMGLQRHYDLDALLRQRQPVDRRRGRLDRHRADRHRPAVLGHGRRDGDVAQPRQGPNVETGADADA